MNVFVIHSGSDKDNVTQILSELKKVSHHFNPLILKNGGKMWKAEASQKIKKAQMIVFFVGKNSHSSPNIAWEIKTAIKQKKPIYTVKLKDEYESHKSLILTDSFSGKESNYDKLISYDDLILLIRNHESGNYKVFNQDLDKIDTKVLLEQYKIFLQTSETLVSRRQNVNSFYISINSALITIFGVLLALEIAPVYKFSTIVLLALVGIILSFSWTKILISYGDLNSSKMKIISCIEKQLPASLYDAEWAALSDKLNTRKYVSFTNSEKKIPRLFIIVYICMCIVAGALLLH